MNGECGKKTPAPVFQPSQFRIRHSASRAAVLDFVRTPLAVRRNVVKVWRPLPADPWTGLSLPEDRARSIRRERRAIVGVTVAVLMLVAGFSSIGLRAIVGEDDLCFPLLGKSLVTPTDGAPGLGWYYLPGQSLSLALWVVVPSLAGWMFVRLIWLPAVASARTDPRREATLTFARYLGDVYFYVYAMVVVGAAFMPLLILLSPKGTETLRWWLWCFLFGESFFVPAVMWLRLVINDSPGKVFGRFRYAALALYLVLFVVIPIGGMVQELD